ncbi:MAG: glycoside hydrolase family 5 protein, partial [Oscillospiraceae bacterium]|nr:glycoside hydrolase family 5 protein [Oscillospiraceae bacterium]
YTCSDDGNCTRVNLYNQWVTSVPDDGRHADGDNSGLSATVLSVKDNEILSTLEITFTYSAP